MFLHVDVSNPEPELLLDNDDDGESSIVVVAKKKTENRNKTGTFVCVDCNKKFTRDDNLLKHKKIYHSNEPPEQFFCDFCSNSFDTKFNLERHIKCHI